VSARRKEDGGYRRGDKAAKALRPRREAHFRLYSGCHTAAAQALNMTVPNAERAIIAVEKLIEYLLNMSHKRGAAKARLLLGVGYRPDAPRLLESDLRAQHLSLDVTRMSENAYGVVYRGRRSDQDAHWKDRAVLLDLADRRWNRGAAVYYNLPEVGHAL
jgi:hypothetical protein